MFDTLLHRINELADQKPDEPVLIFKKDIVTYRQLMDRILQVGALLKDAGIRSGDRVLYTSLSKPESVVLYLGIQYAGGTAVFLDKNATPSNMYDIYEDTEAALIITDRPLKEYAEQCTVRSLKELYAAACDPKTEVPDFASTYVLPDPEAYAEMIFTTGTTGRPKGVVLSYRAVYHILQNTREGVQIRETDRVLVPLPLNHSLAMRVLRASLYAGASVVLQNGFTFAKELETNILERGCTGMVTVPASFTLVENQMQDKFAEVLGSLRFIEVGAGSLTVRQRKEYVKSLPNVRITNTWGSSETGGALFTDVRAVASDPVKVAAIGKPLDSVTVKVLGSDGELLTNSSRENPGRLIIEGDMVMSGYWHREPETKDALRNGALVTNDLVYTDEEGYVYMLGRADDIINVGGEKVSPIEIENIACQYGAMKECACIGAEDPNEVLGQVPVLFMAVTPDYTEEDLKTFLASRMERYKMPQEYVLLEAIPRNRMQKIDRRALRDLWNRRGEEADLMNPVIESILSRHSIRKFTDQNVPEKVLEMILKAGYHAPSGHNMQTWRFTVVQDAEKIQRLKEAAAEAAAKNKVYMYGFHNPAAVILVSNDDRNHDGCQDASCAAENMLLAAHSLGLGAAWINVLMTLRHVSPVKELLDEWQIPAGHTVWSMIALGYPAESPKALAKKTTVVSYV